MEQRKFKKDDKCIFLGTITGKAPSNLGVAIGTELIIESNDVAGVTGAYYMRRNNDKVRFGYAYEYELKLSIITEEDIRKEITEHNMKIVILQNKLSFLNATRSSVFNDKEFKAYSVLKTMGIDDIEKARQVVKIMEE